MIFTASKKTANCLLIVGFISINASLQAKIPYAFFDKIGQIGDFFYARGTLNQKYETMFQELCKKFKIQDRAIKARNSGILFRILFGYRGGSATQLGNRVYLNQDFLEEMDEKSAKFLIARAIAQHQEHHDLKQGVLMFFFTVIQKIMEATAYAPNTNKHLSEYLTTGKEFSVFGLPIFCLSLSSLIHAQILQSLQIEADTQALYTADITQDDAIQACKYLYDTNNVVARPLYAKIQSLLVAAYRWITSWPILKQHTPELVSFDDRAAHIKTLQKSS